MNTCLNMLAPYHQYVRTGRVSRKKFRGLKKNLTKSWNNGQKLQDDREALHAGGQLVPQATGDAAVPKVCLAGWTEGLGVIRVILVS